MTGLRQKMEQVESRFEECYTMMENTEGTVKELWGAAEETKALATSLIREAVEKMQAEFKERDEEMDHKFSLQVAENKRLQGHMAEIRKENAARAAAQAHSSSSSPVVWFMRRWCDVAADAQSGGTGEAAADVP